MMINVMINLINLTQVTNIFICFFKSYYGYIPCILCLMTTDLAPRGIPLALAFRQCIGQSSNDPIPSTNPIPLPCWLQLMILTDLLQQMQSYRKKGSLAQEYVIACSHQISLGKISFYLAHKFRAHYARIMTKQEPNI